MQIMLLPLYVRIYYIAKYFEIYRKVKKPNQQRPYKIIETTHINILIVDAVHNKNQWHLIEKERYFKSNGLNELKGYFK